MIQFFEAMSSQPSDGLWLHRVLQIGLHSTLLLVVGFLAAFAVRHRGAVLRALIYRMTLVSVAFCLLWPLLGAMRFDEYVTPAWSLSPFSSNSTEQLLRSGTIVAKTWQPPVAPEASIRPASAASPATSSAPPVISSEDPATLATPALKELLTGTVINRLEVTAYRLWLLGAVGYFTWLLVCYLSITKLRRQGTAIEEGELHQLLLELCQSMNLHPPLLLSNGQVSSPFLTGLLRPAILVPTHSEAQFSPESWRIILIHELTHLARRDLWWSALATLVRGLLWPQLLLSLLSRRMQMANEEICDQSVLDYGCAPQEYARNLLDWAERLQLKPMERTMGLGVTPIRSTLGRRVQQILNRSAKGLRPIPAWTRALVGTGMTAIAGLVLTMFAVKAATRIDGPVIVGGPLAAEVDWPTPLLPERDAFSPQSQTVRGMTMRLSNAAWGTNKLFHGSDPLQKHFTLWYEVESQDPGVNPSPGKTLKDYIISQRALDPMGQPVDGTVIRNSTVVAWDNVDPRWAHVPLEFELLDPAAPPAASGEFEELLLFKDVPIPAKAGEVGRVDRTLTTANGTRVILEKLAVRPEGQKGKDWINFRASEEGQVVLGLRWEPPARVPDLTANLSIGIGGVIDDTGKDLAAPGSLGMGQIGGDDLEEQPGQRQQTLLSGGRNTLYVSTRPAPKARTLAIRIQVQERAQSLKQEKWLRRFRFEVPLQNVPFAFTPQTARPVAVAEDRELTSVLESIGTSPNTDTNGWYTSGRLYLRDGQSNQSGNPRDKTVLRRWVIEESTPRDKPNRESAFIGSSFWKADNTPVREGETAAEFSFFDYNARQPSQKLTLEFKVAAESRTRHTLDFANLPIPRNGQISEINQSRQLPSGARFILRQVGYFTEYQGTDSNGKPLKPLTRFGLLYDYKAAAGAETKPSYKGLEATDDKARPVVQNSGIVASGNQIYMRPPGADAKSINVRLFIDEVTTGPRRTLVFLNLKPTLLK